MTELSNTWTNIRLREFPQKPLDDLSWREFLKKFYASYPNYDSTRNIFVELTNGIGDQVCVLGLLPSLRAIYNPKHLFVFARESSKDLITLFPNVIDKLIWFSNRLEFTGELNPSGSPFNTLLRPTKAHILNGRMNPIFTQFGIPYIDQYRIGLGLPLNAKFHPPTALQMPSQERKGAVILFPHSNTWETAPLEFWSFTAKRLISAGINVYTNVTNKVNNDSFLKTSKIQSHEPIEGTSPLITTLPELVSESSLWRGWISGVSGPAWLLSHSECKKIVVHRTEVLPRSVTRHSSPAPIRLIDIDRVSSNFPFEAIEDFEFESEGNFNTQIADSIING